VSEPEPDRPNALQRNVPPMAAALRNIIIFVTVLSIPLTTAQILGLSASETSSWILALYGLTGLLSLVLAVVYRQPLLVTGNLFFIIFISGLGDQLTFPELMGASLLAGVGVLIIGLLGLSKRLARLIPLPIMFGLLAGAVLPFLSDFFSELGEAPAVVGGTLLAYLLSRALLGDRLPAILPALVTGLVVTGVTGQFAPLDGPLSLAAPRLAWPVFSLPAILTATPVFIVLITLQANLPSLRFLHSQDYDPPEVTIDLVSGLGTVLGSFLGPVGVSLSLPATSLVAGPGAGDPEIRHRSVYVTGGAALVVGLLAGVAAALAGTIPPVLLLTLAGLSLVNVLANALQRVTEGPLLIGPLFAFAIALSDISFLGFGNYFWSLVIGTAISLLVERDALRTMRRSEEADEAASA
jgi:benzoate membrane transport protein